MLGIEDGAMGLRAVDEIKSGGLVSGVAIRLCDVLVQMRSDSEVSTTDQTGRGWE